MGSKRETTVRVMRVQISGAADDGDYAEIKTRLRAVATEIQQVVNDMMAHWLRLHYEAGNHHKIREWMAADTAWVKTPKAEREPATRAPCPVKPLDAAMSRAIYAAMREDHPGLGTKPVGLAMQKQQKRLIGAKASKSAYPRWMRILAGYGEYPSSANPLPIPFFKTNARLIVPKEGEPWQLEVRLEQSATSKGLVAHRVTLFTGGRKLQSLRNGLWKIAAREWKFCASDLVQRDGRWYAHICYQFPAVEKPQLDAGRVAILSAGRDKPIRLRIDGRTLPMWRRGNDIRYLRKSLTMQRTSRNEAYRSATSARKGHGKKRAHQWREKLLRRWQDFVKTWNGQLAADIAKQLRASGVGRLIYCQPAEQRRDGRFLSRAGKTASRKESTLWDWHGLGAQLGRVLQENGIKVETRKMGERRIFGGRSAKGKSSKAVACDEVQSDSE